MLAILFTSLLYKQFAYFICLFAKSLNNFSPSITTVLANRVSDLCGLREIILGLQIRVHSQSQSILADSGNRCRFHHGDRLIDSLLHILRYDGFEVSEQTPLTVFVPLTAAATSNGPARSSGQTSCPTNDAITGSKMPRRRWKSAVAGRTCIRKTYWGCREMPIKCCVRREGGWAIKCRV